MAKVKLNSMLKEVHGRVGDVIFRQSHTGEMSVTKLPDMSNVQWSTAQQAHRQRFKLAVAYAKAAMAEPKVRARYEKAALKAGKRPFDLAVADYFKGKDLLTPKSK